MNNKVVWGYKETLLNACNICIDWCIRARDKGSILSKDQELFFSYVIQNSIDVQQYKKITSLFQYSQKDQPTIKPIRDNLLRCLSASIRTQYYLFPESYIIHEPYFFIVPNLGSDDDLIGLIHKIDTNNITILTSNKKLDLIFSKEKIITDFTNVVIQDSFKWFNIKTQIKQGYSRQYQPSLQQYQKQIKNIRAAKNQDELNEYGVILEPNYYLKDVAKSLGAEWNANLKIWAIPNNTNIDTLVEYYQSKLKLINKESMP